jgi:hypothetical protein
MTASGRSSSQGCIDQLALDRVRRADRDGRSVGGFVDRDLLDERQWRECISDTLCTTRTAGMFNLEASRAAYAPIVAGVSPR